jgi:hypothetical protein
MQQPEQFKCHQIWVEPHSINLEKRLGTVNLLIEYHQKEAKVDRDKLTVLYLVCKW